MGVSEVLTRAELTIFFAILILGGMAFTIAFSRSEKYIYRRQMRVHQSLGGDQDNSGLFRRLTSTTSTGFEFEDILSDEEISAYQNRFKALCALFPSVSEEDIREMISVSPLLLAVETEKFEAAVECLNRSLPYVDPCYVLQQRAPGVDLLVSCMSSSFDLQARVKDVVSVLDGGGGRPKADTKLRNVTEFIRRVPHALTPRYLLVLKDQMSLSREMLGFNKPQYLDVVETWPGILGIDLKAAVVRLNATLVRSGLFPAFVSTGTDASASAGAEEGSSITTAEKKKGKSRTSSPFIAESSVLPEVPILIKTVPRVLMQDISRRLQTLRQMFPNWNLQNVIRQNPRLLTQKISGIREHYQSLSAALATEVERRPAKTTTEQSAMLLTVDDLVNAYPRCLRYDPEILLKAATVASRQLGDASLYDVCVRSTRIYGLSLDGQLVSRMKRLRRLFVDRSAIVPDNMSARKVRDRNNVNVTIGIGDSTGRGSIKGSSTLQPAVAADISTESARPRIRDSKRTTQTTPPGKRSAFVAGLPSDPGQRDSRGWTSGNQINTGEEYLNTLAQAPAQTSSSSSALSVEELLKSMDPVAAARLLSSQPGFMTSQQTNEGASTTAASGSDKRGRMSPVEAEAAARAAEVAARAQVDQLLSKMGPVEAARLLAAQQGIVSSPTTGLYYDDDEDSSFGYSSPSSAVAADGETFSLISRLTNAGGDGIMNAGTALSGDGGIGWRSWGGSGGGGTVDVDSDVDPRDRDLTPGQRKFDNGYDGNIGNPLPILNALDMSAGGASGDSKEVVGGNVMNGVGVGTGAGAAVVSMPGDLSYLWDPVDDDAAKTENNTGSEGGSSSTPAATNIPDASASTTGVDGDGRSNSGGDVEVEVSARRSVSVSHCTDDLDVSRLVLGNQQLFVDRFPYFMERVKAWIEEHGSVLALSVLTAVPAVLVKKPASYQPILKALYTLVMDAKLSIPSLGRTQGAVREASERLEAFLLRVESLGSAKTYTRSTQAADKKSNKDPEQSIISPGVFSCNGILTASAKPGLVTNAPSMTDLYGPGEPLVSTGSFRSKRIEGGTVSAYDILRNMLLEAPTLLRRNPDEISSRLHLLEDILRSLTGTNDCSSDNDSSSINSICSKEDASLLSAVALYEGSSDRSRNIKDIKEKNIKGIKTVNYKADSDITRARIMAVRAPRLLAEAASERLTLRSRLLQQFSMFMHAEEGSTMRNNHVDGDDLDNEDRVVPSDTLPPKVSKSVGQGQDQKRSVGRSESEKWLEGLLLLEPRALAIPVSAVARLFFTRSLLDTADDSTVSPLRPDISALLIDCNTDEFIRRLTVAGGVDDDKQLQGHLKLQYVQYLEGAVQRITEEAKREGLKSFSEPRYPSVPGENKLSQESEADMESKKISQSIDTLERTLCGRMHDIADVSVATCTCKRIAALLMPNA